MPSRRSFVQHKDFNYLRGTFHETKLTEAERAIEAQTRILMISIKSEIEMEEARLKNLAKVRETEERLQLEEIFNVSNM